MWMGLTCLLSSPLLGAQKRGNETDWGKGDKERNWFGSTASEHARDSGDAKPGNAARVRSTKAWPRSKYYRTNSSFNRIKDQSEIIYQSENNIFYEIK